MRHMGLCGTKEGFLKGLCLGSPNPELSAEAAICKASRCHMKEIHLLIKALVPAWLLPWTDAGGQYLPILSLSC